MPKRRPSVIVPLMLSVLLISACQPQGPLMQPEPQDRQAKAAQAQKQASRQAPQRISLEFRPALLGEAYAQTEAKPFSASRYRGVGYNRVLRADSSFRTQAHVDLPQPLTPILECVRHNPNGSYTAFFGYQNQNSGPVTIPIGANNRFHIQEQNRGQPTVFAPGRSPLYPESAFTVDFSQGNLVWHLNGQVVTATRNPNQRCAAIEPSPSPSPSPTPEVSPSPTPDPSPTATSSPTPVPSETPTPTPVPTFEPITDVVFDPADPESLGELYPNIPGNADLEIPQTAEAAMSVNGAEMPQAAIGEAIIDVAEPVAENLAQIKARYLGDAIPIDEADGVYLLKANLRSVDLANLEQNLLLLNAESSDPEVMVRSAGFGNLESARTFALIADLLASQPVKGADFNTMGESSGNFSSHEGWLNLAMIPSGAVIPLPSPTPTPSPSPSGSPGAPYFPADVKNFWWLNEYSTQVLQAWDYNMGFNYAANKPVQVAVVDSGFAGMNQLMANGMDFAGQILVNQGFIDKQSFQYGPVDGIIPPFCLNCNYAATAVNPVTPYTQALMSQEDVLSCTAGTSVCNLSPGASPGPYANYQALKLLARTSIINFPQDHGTNSASTIVSALSNQQGVVGAAPYAQVIPVKVGNGLSHDVSETIHALDTIRTNPAFSEVDVVSASLSPTDLMTDSIFRNVTSGRFGDGSYSRIKKAVDGLAERGTIVVFSAGNNGVNAANNWYTLTNAIVVGAVQLPAAGVRSTPSLPIPPNPAQLVRSVWGTVFGRNQTPGSNWSPGQADNSNSANLDNIVTVYAPGSEMLGVGIPRTTYFGPAGSVAIPSMTANRVGSTQIGKWDGTSAAAPLVSGIVALMKGIKENLSIVEVRNAFYTTSFVNSYTDTNLFRADGTPFSAPLQLRIANAEGAVQKIYQDNQTGDGRMRSYFGTMLQVGDSYQLRLSDGSGLVYNLQWGRTSSVNTLTTQLNLTVQESGAAVRTFTPVSAAVNQFVQIQGQLRGNRLYVHQLSLDRQPDAPTGLMLNSVTSSNFKVSWNPTAGATSYEVKISGPSGAVTQTVNAPELLVQYYPAAPTPLTPGTTYAVTVAARTTNGLSPESQVLTVQTLAPSPTPTPACNVTQTDTVITDTSWRWSSGGTVIVSNPYFTPQIPGAFPIWASSGACNQCSFVFFKDYFLPAGWNIKRASVLIQASEYADISVRGRAVGRASYQNSVTPRSFDIDPTFFGTSGNTLSLTFLAQNFSLPRPAVLAKFTIERCRP